MFIQLVLGVARCTHRRTLCNDDFAINLAQISSYNYFEILFGALLYIANRARYIANRQGLARKSGPLARILGDLLAPVLLSDKDLRQICE